MFRSRKASVSISMAREALESIFDECDRYDVDETGGRLIGCFRKHGNQYDIQVLGVIGPGPNARRSPTSFFQDGDYQERVFRSIEEAHPNIEHLGNWHTHHVNGLRTLSGGDKTTYFTTVNHAKHNTDFFYALLVVRKNAGRDPRYQVRHFFFRRNDDTVYEIPAERVRFVDARPLCPGNAERATSTSECSHESSESTPNLERAKDQEFFAEFYPGLRALFSKTIGALYWKGPMPLIDGSHADVATIESVEDGVLSYTISAAGGNAVIASVSAEYKERRFRSARHAVLNIERNLNQELYRRNKG